MVAVPDEVEDAVKGALQKQYHAGLLGSRPLRLRNKAPGIALRPVPEAYRVHPEAYRVHIAALPYIDSATYACSNTTVL